MEMPVLQNQDWSAILNELRDFSQPPMKAQTASGAVLLGQGQTADVWGIGPYALKMYRLRRAVPVRELMNREIDTYQRLATRGAHLLMPTFFGSGIFDDETSEYGACGWALLGRLPGAPLSFDELRELEPKHKRRWIKDFVRKSLLLEEDLGRAEAGPHWHSDYASVRLQWLMARAAACGDVAAPDFELAKELCGQIAAMTVRRKFIHGDFNPQNIMSDFSASDDEVISFIDPLINFDAPEANFRHLTALPELAEECAFAYAGQSSKPLNLRLLYAIGAMTHLYMGIADSPQKNTRKEALDRCLSRLAQ